MNLQYNAKSGLDYEGGRNQGELMATKEFMKFESDGWVTFLQAYEMKLKIKKGSKGVHIFKGFKSFDEIDKESGKIKTVSRPVGFATVFNMDQTETNKEVK